MAMEIQHDMQAQKGVFYIQGADKRSAEMSYVWAGTTKIIIDHTEVGEELKGKELESCCWPLLWRLLELKTLKFFPFVLLRKLLWKRPRNIRMCFSKVDKGSKIIGPGNPVSESSSLLNSLISSPLSGILLNFRDLFFNEI